VIVPNCSRSPNPRTLSHSQLKSSYPNPSQGQNPRTLIQVKARNLVPQSRQSHGLHRIGILWLNEASERVSTLIYIYIYIYWVPGPGPGPGTLAGTGPGTRAGARAGTRASGLGPGPVGPGPVHPALRTYISDSLAREI